MGGENRLMRGTKNSDSYKRNSGSKKEGEKRQNKFGVIQLYRATSTIVKCL
jgi:hypothetical protein